MPRCVQVVAECHRPTDHSIREESNRELYTENRRDSSAATGIEDKRLRTQNKPCKQESAHPHGVQFEILVMLVMELQELPVILQWWRSTGVFLT